MTHKITRREIDVLTHLICGKSNKHIANELGISPYTVRDHITSMMSKLGAHNRVELSMLALRFPSPLTSDKLVVIPIQKLHPTHVGL